jgi:RNA polymerase sigma factor (sigma-70 family)
MGLNEFVELKAELKSGEDTRLKLVFENYSVYCINKLIGLHSCSREDAQDIYVEAVLNLREKIIAGQIDSILDVRAYLFATCRNMLLVSFKKDQRIRNATKEWHEDQKEEICSDSLSGERYRDHIMELTQLAMANLPIKCREILKAFYFDKLGLEEIAKSMAFANANVVKVSKSRCFQKLAEEIKLLQNKNKSQQNATK